MQRKKYVLAAKYNVPVNNGYILVWYAIIETV